VASGSDGFQSSLEIGLEVYTVGRIEEALCDLQQNSGAIPVQADVRDTEAVARQ
jgi:hypothetical protein